MCHRIFIPFIQYAFGIKFEIVFYTVSEDVHISGLYFSVFKLNQN